LTVLIFFQFAENSSQAEIKLNDVVDSHKEAAFAVSRLQPNPYNLEIGSIIQYGEPPQCGVIKWIGNLPDQTEVIAGVEMVRKFYSIYVGTFCQCCNYCMYLCVKIYPFTEYVVY